MNTYVHVREIMKMSARELRQRAPSLSEDFGSRHSKRVSDGRKKTILFESVSCGYNKNIQSLNKLVILHSSNWSSANSN